MDSSYKHATYAGSKGFSPSLFMHKIEITGNSSATFDDSRSDKHRPWNVEA